MKTKRILEQDQQKFHKDFDEIVKKYNLQENEGYYNYYIENNNLGKLLIKKDNNTERLLTIFTRFENPEKAKEYFLCNLYSGKHNFHYREPELILKDFEGFIQTLNNIENFV